MSPLIWLALVILCIWAIGIIIGKLQDMGKIGYPSKEDEEFLSKHKFNCYSASYSENPGRIGFEEDFHSLSHFEDYTKIE